MKKKILIAILLLVMCLTCVFAACKPDENDTPDTKFIVTFDSQGGSTVQAKNASKLTLAEMPIPTRDGFDFAGWYTDKDCADEHAVTYPFTVTKDIILYAKWEDNGSSETAYNVKFVPNGGTPVSAMNVASIAAEPVTTRTYYVFKGWFDNEKLEGDRVTFPLKLTKDITLYAKWQPTSEVTFTVTFNSNGGSAVPSKEVKPTETIDVEPVPTKLNAEFMGWFNNEKCWGDRIEFPYEPTDDETLYAKWKVEQNISSDQAAQLKALLQNAGVSNFGAYYIVEAETEDNSGNFTKQYQWYGRYAVDGDTLRVIEPVPDGNGGYVIITNPNNPNETGYAEYRTYYFKRDDGGYLMYVQNVNGNGEFTCLDEFGEVTYDYQAISGTELEQYVYMIYANRLSALNANNFYPYDGKWYAKDEYVNEIATLVLGNTSGDVSLPIRYTSFALTFDADGKIKRIDADSVVTVRTDISQGYVETYFYYTYSIAIGDIGNMDLPSEGEFLNDADRPSGLYPELDKDDANRNSVTSDDQVYTVAQLKNALESLADFTGYYTLASNYYGQGSYVTSTAHNRNGMGKVKINFGADAIKECYYKYDDATGAFFLAMPNSNLGYDVYCSQYSYKNNYYYNQFLLGIEGSGCAILYNCVQPAPLVKLIANKANEFVFNETDHYFSFNGSVSDMTELGKSIFGDLDLVYPEANETETYTYFRVYMNGGKVVKVLAASGVTNEDGYTEYFLKEVVVMNETPEQVEIPANILARFVAPGEAKENGSVAALGSALTDSGINLKYTDKFVYMDDEELGGVHGSNSDNYVHYNGITKIEGDHYLYFKNGNAFVAYKSDGTYAEYPLDMKFIGGDVEKYNEWVSWILPINKMLNADWFYEGKDGKFYGKAENMSELSKVIARFSGSESFLEGDAGIRFNNAYRWTVVLDFVSVSLSNGKLDEIYYSGNIHVAGISGSHDKIFSGVAKFSYDVSPLTLPSVVTGNADTVRPEKMPYKLNASYKFSVDGSNVLHLDEVEGAAGYKMYVYTLNGSSYELVGEPITVTDNYDIAANHPELIDQTSLYKIYYISVKALGGDLIDAEESEKVQIELSKYDRVADPVLTVDRENKVLNFEKTAPNGYHIEITGGATPVVADINEKTYSLAALPVGVTYTIEVYAKGDGATTRDSNKITARYTPYNDVPHVTALLSQIDFSQSFAVNFMSQTGSLNYVFNGLLSAEEIFGLGTSVKNSADYVSSLDMKYDKATNTGKFLLVIYKNGGVRDNPKDNLYRASFTFSVQNGKLVGTLKTTAEQQATVTESNREMNVPFKGLSALDETKFVEVGGKINDYGGLAYEYGDISDPEVQELLSSACFVSDMLGKNLTFTALRVHVSYDKNGEYDLRGGNAITVIAQDEDGKTYAFRFRFDSLGLDLSQKVSDIGD